MGIFKNLFGKNKKKERKVVESIEKDEKKTSSLYTKSVYEFFKNFKDPEIIQDKIFEITKSDEKTTLIYLFIPYFFSRKVIPEVKWTDYYNVQSENGKITSYKFEQSQTLMELKKNIDENWKEYCEMDLNKILFHSGDFRAINEMMHKGSKLEDLEAVPPTIMG